MNQRNRLVDLMYLCFLLSFLIPASGQSTENITWLEADAPPFFIKEGKHAGTGYQDVVGDILIASLPQYTHSRITANVARHYEEFKKGGNVCTNGFFKTPEREKFLYYSIPSFFTFPSVLIIKKDRFEEFGGQKVISLEKLLKNKTKIIGLAKDRSYGSEIDALLEQFGTKINTVSIGSLSLSQNLFEMFKLDRVDALIALPEEAAYNTEKFGFRDSIMTLLIQENQKNYQGWLSYVACSKTDWGKKAIEDINEVLLRQRPTEMYRNAYEYWLDPSSIEQYRKLYSSHFLSITQ